jgi:F-type H+-transporting ATPase subunit b
MRIRALLAVSGVAVVLVLGAPGIAGAGTQEDPGGSTGGAGTTEDTGVEISHESEECIHILEEGGDVDDCQEAPSLILPEWNEIIWGGLAFLILLGVMWKFALPPVRNMMKQREDRIRSDLERAEQAKAEGESELAEYRRQLADARNEAGRIIEEARQAADQVRQDLINRAEADAAEIRQRAQQDVQLGTERAMVDLQQRVAELSVELAEKVVERNLDRDTQIALIESYINQVGNGQR